MPIDSCCREWRQRRCRLFKLGSQTIGRVFHAGKDKYLIPLIVHDQVAQQLAFAFLGDAPGFLRNQRAFLVLGNFDRDGIVEVGVGELTNFSAERCREHQSLTLGGKQLDDTANIVDEAHVEHAVGFVENKKFHFGKVNIELAGMIEQAAGGGDEKVATFEQRFRLRTNVDAAENQNGVELGLSAICPNVFVDLCGQFSRRRENQRTHFFAARALGAASIFEMTGSAKAAVCRCRSERPPGHRGRIKGREWLVAEPGWG